MLKKVFVCLEAPHLMHYNFCWQSVLFFLITFLKNAFTIIERLFTQKLFDIVKLCDFSNVKHFQVSAAQKFLEGFGPNLLILLFSH